MKSAKTTQVYKPSKDEILAVSSSWVAATLNVLPGLGAGYLYQRRWKAYWSTSFITFAWGFISLSRQLGIDPSDPAPVEADQSIFYGLLFVSLVTAFEAWIAVARARSSLNYESTESTS